MRGLTLAWGVMAPCLALSALGGDLGAQQIPSSYQYIEQAQEAGPFVGQLNANEGRFGFGPQPGLALGARYGVELSGPFGLEGGALYFPTTRDVINPRLGASSRRVGVADVALVLIDVRLRFSLTGRRTWHGLSPYLATGGGLGFDTSGNQPDDQKLQETDRFDFGTSFLGIFGGGVRWTLAERLVARGDAQLLLWQLDTPDGFQDEGLDFQEVPTSEWVSNRLLSLGLSYRF